MRSGTLQVRHPAGRPQRVLLQVRLQHLPSRQVPGQRQQRPAGPDQDPPAQRDAPRPSGRLGGPQRHGEQRVHRRRAGRPGRHEREPGCQPAQALADGPHHDRPDHARGEHPPFPAPPHDQQDPHRRLAADDEGVNLPRQVGRGTAHQQHQSGEELRLGHRLLCDGVTPRRRSEKGRLGLQHRVQEPQHAEQAGQPAAGEPASTSPVPLGWAGGRRRLRTRHLHTLHRGLFVCAKPPDGSGGCRSVRPVGCSGVPRGKAAG